MNTSSKPLQVGFFSQGLTNNDTVKKYFKGYVFKYKPSEQTDVVIGWGRKENTRRALEFSKQTSSPYLALEDGFIHSMSQGRLGSTSWSLVVDSLGIFYDATSASSLEENIMNTSLSSEQRKRVERAIDLIKKFGITKYNNAKMEVPSFIGSLRSPVLVVDQVEGDMSIEYSCADLETFDLMLNAAIKENEFSDIVIKVHPDVVNGKRKGCVTLAKNLPKNVYVVSENINPIKLLEKITKVYVVSSQLGFEALLLGKSVVCFGVPFYGGWGMTDDRKKEGVNAFYRRNREIDIQTLFYSSYISYSYYFHPISGERCELEDILDFVKLQYVSWSKYRGKLYCVGFSPWKRRFIKSYFQSPDTDIEFVKTVESALKKGFNSESTICLWSNRYEEVAKELSDNFDTPVWKIEDGFIRSISLGSNYAPPASLVVDKSGIYFDPTTSSDLETLLSSYQFTPSLLSDADELKNALISKAVSKYNVGVRCKNNLYPSSLDKRRILVPGQVSDDASILKGCVDIKSNLELLKVVRVNYPKAFIIYKPHPDVVSGNRKGELSTEYLKKYCDQVVVDVSISDCLSQVDEVHTMTSLVGFEGLMHEKKVYCYGVPFYAGWGLTVDRHTCNRRSRKLVLNELIAGVLILYPLYINWDTHQYTTPLDIVNKIHKQLIQLESSEKLAKPSVFPLGRVRKKINLIKTMFYPKLK